MRAQRAEATRARLTRWRIEARRAHTDAWRWRLITVSPPWSPTDPREVDPAGLARRVADLRARCAALWDHALSIGGLAAVTMRVELSARGHVHMHMLYFGPWQHAMHLRRVAGCVVDVRLVRPDRDTRGVVLDRGEVRAGGVDIEGAVREVAKYALKSPGSCAQEWTAGASRRVAHPRLVAAWQTATRDAQLVTHRGTMRGALAAADLDPPQAPQLAPRQCPACRAPVSEVGTVWSVARLARTLTPHAWRACVRWARDG